MRTYDGMRKQVSWQIEGELLSQHYTIWRGESLEVN